ncbi:tetratricopeptide repeat protein 19, mitochondrial isoform X3 [Dermochelys coriacea]|uniref:tetratricopeptide repeat protein 19, mitochondrial isoform X3 n=1 Tax=Dermochelys coriacea TaxID=27794 RepID=UPI0018E81983|nr:tetratricopeptide repeat protein 19, mitochondrial isoform X3 [Dermochelys coriacea]
MLAALRRGPGLLAVAGRRCSGARLPAGRHMARGGRGAACGAGSLRGRSGPSPGGVLAALAAFSFFSKNAEEEKETKEGEGARTEDTIIFLLKKAKLSIMKGELEEAEWILHEAVRLSHQLDNKRAIIYTYDLMANLAFLRGQLDSAEKLFKAAMSFLLAGDMKQDDNAIVEMSLKLASIYAAQNQHELALAGYEFCILTLDEKIAKYKDLPEDVLPAEERANTYLLLGLCLDSYGRYLLANKQLLRAQRMYERALQISKEVQGETHPQTVVLMNDLATVLDAQGLYDEAYTHGKRASELAKQTEHPEEHMVLNNLAGILMHKEDFLQAKQVYKKALKQAELKGDTASRQHIQEELAELARRRKHSN